jgi:hypothetical protein
MIRIFDTGEKYADRYTVTINNSLYTMSENPSSPRGVNMYCCEIPDEYESVGKEIKMKDLPREVRWAILDRVSGEIRK